MTVSIASSPALIIASKPAAVSLATTEVGANFVRLRCSAAPRGSSLRKRLDAAGSGSVVDAFAGPTGSPWTFVGETSGAYVFTAVECSLGATAYGGGYYADADADAAETVLGTNTVTLYVGARLETRLGVGSDTAKLVCRVWDHNILRTDEVVHGEATPAITSPSSSKAGVAAENASVLAAVNALVAVDAYASVGDLEPLATLLAAWYETHRANATVHAAADSANALVGAISAPASPGGLAACLNDMRLKLDRHMRNDNSGAGSGTGSYHAPGGTVIADSAATILAPYAAPDNRASQLLLIADLRRVLVAHAASAVHTTPDLAAVPAASRMMAVHAAFLSALDSNAPTPPATAHYGAVALVNCGGFTET